LLMMFWQWTNLQNHQPIQVEEVSLEDLVDFEDLAPNQPLPAAPPHAFKDV
jgi:hypothetical protein